MPVTLAELSGLVHRTDINVVVCPTCGLAFLDPMPDDQALRNIYGAHYYRSWGLDRDAEATRQMKKASFSRLLADVSRWLKPNVPILDIGCATGFFHEVAADAGFQPFGIDIARYAIDACEKRFGIGRFYCGQLEEAYFPLHPEGGFGAIFMSDYIEHVRSPRAVLSIAERQLAPGGIVVISTPDVAHRSRLAMGARWPHFKQEHLWYFSPQSLGRLIAETGMKVVAVHGVRKILSIAYLTTQFRQYPMPLVTQALSMLSRVLPVHLADAHLRLPTGEMTIVAIKPLLPDRSQE